MFRSIPFVKKELEIVETRPGFMGRAGMPIRNTPVTARMNYEALYYEKHPYWFPMPGESGMLSPSIYGDNLGRGHGRDITDAFGIRWQFVPSAGGSIVHPGDPLMEDANDWKELIKMPDIDAWDWEGAAAEHKLDPRFFGEMSFINGFWFERLISFMDFMGAAMALIDDEQTDAIHELFEATTDLGCRLVDKFCEYWPNIASFNVHDDWGAQKAPFFSQEVAQELFVPHMKVLTDHIHAKGRIATLHSCGHNADRIQCYIDGGFDQWGPQSMNDINYLYDNFGDKIVLGVWPERADLADAPEAEQRQAARDFADRFCQPGKPAVLGAEGSRRCPPAFLEELYEYSRKKYAAM